ncbi:AmpG family muropeptide MFS transporter [Burkholderiaceae bacterium DAT-1]|nr:AmpG family muropeptide MFS transporter [Burkholderiaceae bacterium DAT-1]
MSEHALNWRTALLSRRMLVCVFTGFSSGLPLFLLLQLLPAWMRSEHVDLKSIGLMTLVQMPYTWKFLWSPFLDRYALMSGWLGRRRGWMVVLQIALTCIIPVLGQFNPQVDLGIIALVSVAIAFLSATQDIVLDAYRRELLDDVEQGLGNIIHVNAYRISGLIPASLALILSDHMPWSSVFLVTALFMLPGAFATLLLSPAPAHQAPEPKGLRESVIGPFREFVQRHGAGSTVLILLFMCMYKLGDGMATALSTAFYLDLGFTKTEIGVIAKQAGLWPAIIGGMVGGIWMLRLGLNRALWIFGAMQLSAVLGFAVLAQIGHDLWALGTAISLEYFGIGLGTAAFVSFIARSTHPSYAATQLALLTSIASLPRTGINAGMGWVAEHLGWTDYFLFCFLAGIPGMIMLIWIAPWNGREAAHSPDA